MAVAGGLFLSPGVLPCIREGHLYRRVRVCCGLSAVMHCAPVHALQRFIHPGQIAVVLAAHFCVMVQALQLAFPLLGPVAFPPLYENVQQSQHTENEKNSQPGRKAVFIEKWHLPVPAFCGKYLPA